MIGLYKEHSYIGFPFFKDGRKQNRHKKSLDHYTSGENNLEIAASDIQ